jgi:hypothetical protein
MICDCEAFSLPQFWETSEPFKVPQNWGLGGENSHISLRIAIWLPEMTGFTYKLRVSTIFAFYLLSVNIAVITSVIPIKVKTSETKLKIDNLTPISPRYEESECKIIISLNRDNIVVASKVPKPKTVNRDALG